jgi:excisionase family DNA binding protein
MDDYDPWPTQAVVDRLRRLQVDKGQSIEVAPGLRMAISVNEAASALGMSASTIWKLIAHGRIPVVRLGRRTLIKVEELQRVLTRSA